MSSRGFGSGGLAAATGGNIASPPVTGLTNRLLLQGSATGNPVRAVVDPASGDTNVTAVVGGPKGTGAIQAQVNDAAATGGNARGTNAVDWQTTRTSAAHVASGVNTTIGGGAGNVSSGAYATVAGGLFCTAAGSRATVSGGESNTVSGTFGWVPGGSSATERGCYGRGAWGSGPFATSGDAQSGEFVIRRITTDATATRLTADGAAQSTTNTVNLPNTGTHMVRLLVTAQQTGGAAGTAGDCAGWELTALIKRGANAAATVLVGSSGASVAPAYSDTAPAAWRIGLTADATNGGLAVTVTGEANKTIRWVARVMSVETTA